CRRASAARRGAVNPPGCAPNPPLQNPVLQGLQIGHAVSRRTYKAIPVDFTYRTDRRNLRLRAVQQRRQLRKTVQHLLERLLVGEVETELQFYVRKAVKRNRPDRPEVWQPGRLRLDRDRDVALDFFRGKTSALRNDVHHRWRRVWSGPDNKRQERRKTADESGREKDDHDDALFQCERDETVHENMVLEITVAPALPPFACVCHLNGRVKTHQLPKRNIK